MSAQNESRKTSRRKTSTAMPSSVDPMLPTPTKLPFSDAAWLFEPKWDGYRALCFLHDGKVRFVSRNRRDLTKRFPELREVADLIKARTAIVDGEIVSLDRAGLPSFDALRHRRKKAVVFYAFDLIYFDGEDLTQYPLVARKAALKRILRKPASARIRYTEHIEEQGERLFYELEALQLEGMVCKRKDSVYATATRSKFWLKVKTTAGREAIRKRIENW